MYKYLIFLFIGVPLFAADCIVQTLRAPVTHGAVVATGWTDPYNNNLVVKYDFNGANPLFSSVGVSTGVNVGAILVDISTNEYGTVNRGYSFDGIDDYLYVDPHDGSLAPASNFTVSCKFKIVAFPASARALMGNAVLGSAGWMWWGQTSFSAFGYRENGVMYNDFQSTATNTWYHTIWTYSGRYWIIYNNAAWKATDDSITYHYIVNTTNHLYLGGDMNGQYDHVACVIDDVRIYTNLVLNTNMQAVLYTNMPLERLP